MKWDFVVPILSKSDKKYEGILKRLGIMAYMAHDQPTKDLFSRAEKNEIINLEGNEGDENRAVLVNSILNM